VNPLHDAISPNANGRFTVPQGAGLGIDPDPVVIAKLRVPYRIFENNQKDGYIFLVALAKKKDAATLAVENDDEIIKIFEEYAAGGLEQIASWLNENATDISGVQALIAKIQAQVPIDAPVVLNPNPI